MSLRTVSDTLKPKKRKCKIKTERINRVINYIFKKYDPATLIKVAQCCNKIQNHTRETD